MATQPLIINGWPAGVADSPNVGFGRMKNVSIDAVSGSVMPGYALAANSIVPGTSTFTWNAGGTCDLTTSGTSLETDGVAVTFSTTGGGTLDTAIVAGTVYFLYKFATGRVIISDTLGHAIGHTPLALNNNGSGTCTVTVVNMGTPNSIAQGYDVSGSFLTFVADSNGRVWYNDGGTQTYLLNGNTLTNSNGKGLALFTNSDASKTFLFVWRNAVVDVCDVTTQAKRRDPVGNSSWSSSWQSLNSSSGFSGSHQALLGQDNIVYACDGRYINSIQEIPGQVFAPGSGSTFTWNSKALTLPSGDAANCLEQLGINLLAGGLNTPLIYPWDRSSPSFALPLICPEPGIYGLKNIGNMIYVLAGLRGIVYKTTGYFVQEAKKIPEYITGNGSSNVVAWGGVSSKNGGLLFGASFTNNSSNNGVYLLFSDGRLIQDNTPSQGAALPTVLGQQGGEFYFAGSAGYLDQVSANRQSSFGAAVESQLYAIGTKVAKATLSLLEVQLDQPGQSGGHVRVSYRTGLSGSWTVLDTYTLDGTATSFDTDIGLQNVENMQFFTELDGTGSGTNATRVREVRLTP